MFSKSLKVRLTTVFSLVFLLGTGMLYVASYLLLSSSLQQEERRLLQAKLLQFWAVYQTARVVGVQRELTLENYVSESTAFFVRLADRENNTIVFFRPGSWRSYDLEEMIEDRGTDGKFGVLEVEPPGTELTYVSVRLFDGTILQVGVSNAQRMKLLSRLRRVYLLVAVPFVLLGVVGGWLAASRALVPVKKLSTMSRFIIDTGSLSRRIPRTGSGDELDNLIGLFNSMVGRIETLVDGMRRSLDDVAHDLRTPMTRLRMRAEEALRNPGNEELHTEAFSAIVSETEGMLKMLTTLLDIAEAETGTMRLERESVDLGALVADIAELYSYSAAEKGVTLDTEVPDGLTVELDVNRMRQVFANLLDNAVKYTEEGGRVTVRGMREPEHIVVEISDTGIGIRQEDLPHIFDRLYRADRSRTKPGLGLGLGLVRAIVEAHDGTVEVASTVEEGSVFTVRLPVSAGIGRS